mmetsp:Transcript_33197/g.50879  ORF Transcript_33197/g.50879 Transcript_33197/m.50879 type:complete len:84 (+) Transcript_33197:855-1106(+)
MYSEGLKNLKVKKLHPKLRMDKQEYLIDIYYPQDKMSQFKTSLQAKLMHLKDEVMGHLSLVGCTRSSLFTGDEAWKPFRINQD